MNTTAPIVRPSTKLLSAGLMAAALALGAVAPASAASLITNGSFEVFNPSDFGGPGYENTYTSIPGWTETTSYSSPRAGINGDGSGVLPTDSTAFANNGMIPDGSHVAFMQVIGSGSNYTSLSQSVTGLVDGASYELSFYVNTRDYGGLDTKFLTVTLGTETLLPTTAYNPVQSVGNFTLPYYSVNIPFTYSSSWGSTLSFTASTTEGDGTLLLDGVALVPEPQTWALAAMGLSAMFFRLRRKQRSSLE